MVRLGQPTLYADGVAEQVEPYRQRVGSVAVQLCKRVAVVGEDRMDLAGHDLQKAFKKLPDCLAVCLIGLWGGLQTCWSSH